MIVLDNASSHHSWVVRDALPNLEARGLTLFYLPPASSELNAIECVFRAIKHTRLPERRYTSQEALRAAVSAAFAEYERDPPKPKGGQPRTSMPEPDNPAHKLLGRAVDFADPRSRCR